MPRVDAAAKRERKAEPQERETTTSGEVSSAVEARIVVNDAATTIRAKPTGSTRAPGRRRPLASSSSSPQPSESVAMTSG
jgi:hypothetical protein